MESTQPSSANSKLQLAELDADLTPTDPREVASVNAMHPPKSHRCGVSLILLMDESASIHSDDWRKQLDATAQALEHPEVLEAIKKVGGIAIMARSFSSTSATRTPWHLITTPEQASEFADFLRGPVIQDKLGTNIGAAVKKSLPYFSLSPCKYPRDVVDIVTDGRSDIGEIQEAREAAIKAGVTVNGIAVNGIIARADEAFRVLKDYLVTPDGTTWKTDWDNFPEIIRRKLIQEIAEAHNVDAPTGLPILKPITHGIQ